MSPTPLPWHLSEIGINAIYPLTGDGVIVVLIDTGIDATHPALAGRIVAAFECSGGGLVPIDHTVDHDILGHGTRMAGLICADRIHGGVAPGARIFSLVYPHRAKNFARVYLALLGLVQAVNNGVINARIVNMSGGLILQDPFERETIQDLIRALLAKEVLVVAAVGNQTALAGLPANSPADFPETLGVGATDQNHRVCDTSRSDPDLVAPGEQILSCERGGTFTTRFGGTSQAAAIATGVAALYLEQARTPPDELRRRITANCVRLVGEPPQRQGHGLIQAP